ncbi:MAG: hypothetical protein H7X77_10700 [Anaerolineae bacterium]|nr:hypothetical protein [Anaerolineae bacterium]
MPHDDDTTFGTFRQVIRGYFAWNGDVSKTGWLKYRLHIPIVSGRDAPLGMINQINSGSFATIRSD